MVNLNGQLIIIADPIQTKRNENNQKRKAWLRDQIKGKNVIYTGLLPGPETETAEIALELSVPYIATIPYKTRYLNWPTKVKNHYLHLIKKSVKTVYVDRQLGYISETCPPDEKCPRKNIEQARWLISKVSKFPGTTHIIVYGSGFYSQKIQAIHTILKNADIPEKWQLTEKTHMEILVPPEDDLPF